MNREQKIFVLATGLYFIACAALWLYKAPKNTIYQILRMIGVVLGLNAAVGLAFLGFIFIYAFLGGDLVWRNKKEGEMLEG